MKKSFTGAILAIIIALSAILSSCGVENSTYSSDIAVSELGAAVDEALGFSETLTEVPDDYIKGMMGIDTSAFADYTVKIRASGANIDEYGIFKAPDGMAVSDVENIIGNYLEMRLEIWMDEYMPEEKPKLENADIEIMGSYVVYCILDDASKDAAFGAVKSALTR